MTTALLEALPPPPPQTRILDACCGSGTIAAVLKARALAAGGDVQLHLIDADAVALTAARANVPSANRFFLCDGWPHTPTAFEKKGRRDVIAVACGDVRVAQVGAGEDVKRCSATGVTKVCSRCS